MVDALLDTAILVDILRNHPPATDWLARNEQFGVTPMVWLEIIDGAQNRAAEKRAVELLRRFGRVDLLPEDFTWAIEQALRRHLSHGVGMMDCLIAAVSHRLQLPLYTRNLRHFTPMLGDIARQPY